MKKHIVTSMMTLIMALAVVFNVTGCGGSSSSGSSSSGSEDALAGMVAVGAPLEADITVTDRQGAVATGRSDSTGHFTINTTGLVAPLMIRATAEDGRVLYSYAVADQETANVTPLTSYIMDAVALELGLGGGVSQLFASFETHYDVSSEVSGQVDTFNTIVAPLIQAHGVNGFDHFQSAFDADHTGYDGMLDAMDIELDGDDLVIRVGDSILDTLSYDIRVQTVSVAGTVLDVLEGTGLSGATVTFVNGDESIVVMTDAQGTFQALLDNYRTYDVTITADGFHPVTYYNVATFALNAISTSLVPLLAETATGTGTVNGHVINARTGASINRVTVTAREGLNSRTSTEIATATTTEGSYSITLPVGVYTLEFSKEGFTTVYANAVALSDGSLETDASMVAETQEGFNNSGAVATIVLSWGQHPEDLDTFLTGPSTVLATRFKLAYYQQLLSTNGAYDGYIADFNASNPCASSEVVASIDLDDTSSFGPETTTVCQVEEGEYRFYVHHYSGTSTMSDSPAQVTVTTASGVSRTFIAPSGAAGDDDLWHVFNMDQNGNITPVNTMTVSGGDAAAALVQVPQQDQDIHLIDPAYVK